MTKRLPEVWPASAEGQVAFQQIPAQFVRLNTFSLGTILVQKSLVLTWGPRKKVSQPYGSILSCVEAEVISSLQLL